MNVSNQMCFEEIKPRPKAIQPQFNPSDRVVVQEHNMLKATFRPDVPFYISITNLKLLSRSCQEVRAGRGPGFTSADLEYSIYITYWTF